MSFVASTLLYLVLCFLNYAGNFVVADFAKPRIRVNTNARSLRRSSSSTRTRFAGLRVELDGGDVSLTTCRSLLKLFRLHCWRRLPFYLLKKFHNFTRLLFKRRFAFLLPLLFCLCSVFKVQLGGPKWTRTTDLTIISRAL